MAAFYWQPTYDAIEARHGEAAADAWVEQVTSGPVALGEPPSAFDKLFQNVVETAFDTLVPGASQTLHQFIPEGGIEPGELLENVVEQYVDPETIVKEAAMSWMEDWGVDFSEIQQAVNTGLQIYNAFDNDGSGGPDVDISSGGSVGTQVALPGAVAAGGIWLGSLLARTLGRGAAGAVFTAANGVRVRISQLWPLVRRYGPQSVAGGLGITVGALGTLLMQPGARTGARRRARGITGRDVKTTRRTLKTIRKLYAMMPTRPARSGYRRSYRRRYRY